MSNAPEVTEEHPLTPLTDYSKFKGECEDILMEYLDEDFAAVIVRPATVCGYSPRQRLDVIVNILTNHAYHRDKIKVNGGAQKRPNIHIVDMAETYLLFLSLPDSKIAGKTYNIGNINHTVDALAEIVRETVSRKTGRTIEIERLPIGDPRSHHISSQKIKNDLNFAANRPVGSAVSELVDAFSDGRLSNTFGDIKFYNQDSGKLLKLDTRGPMATLETREFRPFPQRIFHRNRRLARVRL